MSRKKLNPRTIPKIGRSEMKKRTLWMPAMMA